MTDLALADYLRELAQRLDHAGHGQRGPIMRAACDMLGCSQQELYRKLKSVGWESGRKTRKDRGRSALDGDEAVELGALLMASVRANGKRTMSIKTACEIARANGMLSADISHEQVGRVLRTLGMHPDQVGADTPHIEQRSLHPNHVWQIDASVCVLYYLPAGGLTVMNEREFYKNKPANLKKIEKHRIIRYVAVDHYSGAIYVEYFTGAEDTENLFRFFCSAIAKRDHAGDPFHGVPFSLVLDKGSASEGHVFSNLLERLGVKHLTHLPGNPRAKGSVEVAHNIVERQFESRLAIGTRVENLEQLNGLAHAWMRHFNAHERHSRHGHSRYALWQKIRPEQLRIAPARELLNDLLTTKPVEVTVSRGLLVRYAIRGYGAMTYSVADVPDIRVGEKVRVCVNPYRAPNLHLLMTDREGRETRIELEPRERNDAGFWTEAPVIGETYRAQRETVPDHARKDMLRAAYGVETVREAEAAKKTRKPAFENKVDPHGYLDQVEATVGFMHRKGVELPIEAPRVESAPLTHVACAKRLREAGVDMNRDRFAEIVAAYPDGVPEDAVRALVDRWTGAGVPAQGGRIAAAK
ncbi:MAG: DDE-type integrase/transposase/recombinase [Betaproteobacteria bacterium]|nr:DDE-type integrase/transposase/recombinase [Betaproteobacteria bacterium]